MSTGRTYPSLQRRIEFTMHHDERHDETGTTSGNIIETQHPKRGAAEFQEMVVVS